MNKNTLNSILIACVIILCITVFYRYYYDGTAFFKSTVDNKYYRVRDDTDKQLKVNMLATIKGKLNTIVKTLKSDKRYYKNDAVNRLISNWKNGITIKEIGNMESDAAYVINKQYMSFCIQSKIYTLENINLMTYVAIHELSHIMSREMGPGPEFIKNFQFLLDYSKNLKYFDIILDAELPLYIQLNKIKTPDKYCGVSLINSIN